MFQTILSNKKLQIYIPNWLKNIYIVFIKAQKYLEQANKVQTKDTGWKLGAAIKYSGEKKRVFV